MTVSKNQAKKAAKKVVAVLYGDVLFEDMTPAGQADVIAAIDRVTEWRASYAGPLLKVRMSLRSFVNTTGIQSALLSQRHKRVPRILAKLNRYPSMQITTMGDIGGCRVVVPALDDVVVLRDHALFRWRENAKTRDYIASPKEDGYRAVHIVTSRDDRLVETQVRTERQHMWADTVERLSRRYGKELKWGDAPPGLASMLLAVSDGLAALDEDRTPFKPTDFLEVFDELTDTGSEVDG